MNEEYITSNVLVNDDMSVTFISYRDGVMTEITWKPENKSCLLK